MKKVMLTLISLATLGLGTVVPLQVNAQPIDGHREHGFQVQDRRHRQQRWENVGGCVDRRRADEEVRRLRHEGYETRIVGCRR